MYGCRSAKTGTRDSFRSCGIPSIAPDVEIRNFQLLSGKREGYTLQEISGQTGLTRYAAQVLLEASLTIGTILLEEDRYVLAKAGWFLLNDKMARVNMEFNHDVNYQGLSIWKRLF